MSQIQGTVKFFDNEKGFGFVTNDETGEDIFVHVTQVENKVPLTDGQKCSYDEGENNKGKCAINVIPGELADKV